MAGDMDFVAARSAFMKLDNVLGRLLLVEPISRGERESTMPGQSGKIYAYIESDVVVLDGDINEDFEELPSVLDNFQISGQAIVGQLEGALKKGRKVLGRLGQKPSATKGFGKAWVLEDPTEADIAVAKAYLAKVREEADNPFS